jgi:hypothetical protein
VEIPSLRDDAEIKRKIYASKHRKFYANKKIVDGFLKESKDKLEAELKKLSKQSWNPNDKSAGIFKIFDQQDRYRCTGTLVGGRMYVVNHVIDERLTGYFTARNHVHSVKLNLEKYCLLNDEIGCFPCEVSSPFKRTDMKVLGSASIVTIFGYGIGENSSPDLLTGFASPLGWCNAMTRSGDCSAPALDADGKIVGFWTHGNGKTFGRFEPITDEFLSLVKETSTSHSGLDFLLRPLSQKL